MLNLVHLHLVLVHIPIILFPLAAILIISQFFYTNSAIKNLANIIIVSSSFIAIAAYLSGEGAEEIAEKIPGILESTIENHEDSALLALWLIGASSLLSLFQLFFNKVIKNQRIYQTVVLLFSISASLSLAWVGYQGGKIRHPEAYQAAAMQGNDNERLKDHEG